MQLNVARAELKELPGLSDEILTSRMNLAIGVEDPEINELMRKVTSLMSQVTARLQVLVEEELTKPKGSRGVRAVEITDEDIPF